MSTVVALVTDAFGGFGGISQFNRDFLTALVNAPKVRRVVAVPRVAEGVNCAIPHGIQQEMKAIGSLRAYSVACAKVSLREKPKLVICGHVNLLPFAVPIAARHRAPLVLVIHGIDAWRPPRLASRLALRRVDHIVSVSHFTINRMMEWAGYLRDRPWTVLTNSIDLTRFKPSQGKPAFLLERYGVAGKRIMLTIGRLSAMERYKGVDEVLEVMPNLLRSFSDLTYLVVGSGSDLPRVRAKATELGLDGHVVFAGRISEEEKVAHYQTADVFVMPGHGEGFGIVYLEAMACGVPVVASICDGSREAVAYGAMGNLCDPRDRSSIVQAVTRALHVPKPFVPDRLAEFSYREFRDRVHKLVSSVANSR